MARRKRADRIRNNLIAKKKTANGNSSPKMPNHRPMMLLERMAPIRPPQFMASCRRSVNRLPHVAIFWSTFQ